MSKISLPISLLNEPNVSSLKALRARNKAREAAGAPLAEAEKLRETVHSWMDHVASFDDGPDDFAAHKEGLIVLSDKVEGNVSGRKQMLSAELAHDSGGKPSSARVEVTPYHWNNEELNTGSLNVLEYKRTGNRETYSENLAGYKVTLVIDRAKGTLTFDHPDLDSLR